MIDDQKEPMESADQAADVEDYRAVFANLMKEAREKAGYSRTQLADSTRIMLRFIEALEAGDFEALPGDVFARGFIKNLCKTLGADPQPMIIAFEKVTGANKGGNTSLEVPVQESVAKVKLVSDRANRLRELKDTFIELVPRHVFSKVTTKNLLIFGGIFLGLCFLGYVVSVTSKESNETAEEETVQEETIVSASEQASEDSEPMIVQSPATQDQTHPAEAEQEVSADLDPATLPTQSGKVETEALAAPPVEVAAEKPAVVPVAERVPEEAQYKVEAKSESASTKTVSGPQVVQMTVLQSVKIRMRIDQDQWVTTQYEPKEYEFRFNQVAEFLVFNAAAVSMSFNGKALGSLGKEGRVRRLSFVSANEDLENTKKL